MAIDELRCHRDSDIRLRTREVHFADVYFASTTWVLEILHVLSPHVTTVVTRDTNDWKRFTEHDRAAGFSNTYSASASCIFHKEFRTKPRITALIFSASIHF